ncbi:hypothetical protein ABK040_012167 [Willaertia magna]
MKKHQLSNIGSSADHAYISEEESTEEEDNNKIETDSNTKRRKLEENVIINNNQEDNNILLSGDNDVLLDDDDNDDDDDDEYLVAIKKKTELMMEAVQRRNELFEHSKSIALESIMSKHKEASEAEEGTLRDVPPLDLFYALKEMNDNADEIILQYDIIENLLKECEEIQNEKKKQLKKKEDENGDGSN